MAGTFLALNFSLCTFLRRAFHSPAGINGPTLYFYLNQNLPGSANGKMHLVRGHILSLPLGKWEGAVEEPRQPAELKTCHIGCRQPVLVSLIFKSSCVWEIASLRGFLVHTNKNVGVKSCIRLF